MWMQQALHLAQQGKRSCSPNPMVGCVIVKNNRLIGQGFHEKAGCSHAEAIALAQAGIEAQGADVYVTLEPCSHFGRTPPCVDALIKANVKSVHIAILDSNPLVINGRTIEKLQEAGIHVHVGQCQEEAYQLNRVFFHYITKKRPYVIAKWAMSLDGKIAMADGSSKWITSPLARHHAHDLRSHMDAILVGANTLRQDNPHLTARVDDKRLHTRQPCPIVISASGNLPLDSHLLQPRQQTLVISSDRMPTEIRKQLEDRHINYHLFPLIEGNFIIDDVLKSLAESGVSQILVEGGSHLLTAFFKADCVNEVYTYIAPKIMGGKNSLTPVRGEDLLGMEQIHQLHGQQMVTLDPDVCMIAQTSQTPKSYDEFKKREGAIYV